MKLKRLTAMFLMAATLITSLGSFGCKDDVETGDSSSSSSTETPAVTGPTATGVIKDMTDHYVEGTLHDVNVDDANPVSDFVKNGKTDYKIVLGETMDVVRASSFVNGQLDAALGVRLDVVDIAQVKTIDENTQYIFFGCGDVLEELGEDVETLETLTESGYQIKTVGKNVFINSYTTYGYQLAAIAFLRATVGYDMLSEDLVIFEKKGDVMPSIDIVEACDFSWGVPTPGGVTNIESYGMGFREDAWIAWYPGGPGDPGSMHGWNSFVSKQEAKENPDWASPDANQNQPCYYARGNKQRFKELLDHSIERTKVMLEKIDSGDNVTLFGQNDTAINNTVEMCSCNACKASYNYYGGTVAGAWMSLCKRIAINVDEWLASDEAIALFGRHRKINWLQLVYHSQANAPAEKDANGNYILDEQGRGIPMVEKWFNEDGEMEDWPEELAYGCTPDREDHKDGRLYNTDTMVTIWAPSRSDFTHSYYESNNVGLATQLKIWGGFGGDMMHWLYSQNFRNYMYPFNTFDSEQETLRFHLEVGAHSVYFNQTSNINGPGFSSLRIYLQSKYAFDVNADANFYTDKFFKYYYGAAAPQMKKYFEELVAYMRVVEQVHGINGGTQVEPLGDAINWPQGMLIQWWNDMEDMLFIIENEYKTTDYDKYLILRNHILEETLFPRFALCHTYASSYSEKDLKAMRKAFTEDFYALGNMYYKEGHFLSELAWELE